MPPPIVHHPAFRAEMPAGHRFPMDKLSRLAALLEREGLPGPGGFHLPEPVDVETLLLVHTEDYVRGVIEQVLSLPVVATAPATVTGRHAVTLTVVATEGGNEKTVDTSYFGPTP